MTGLFLNRIMEFVCESVDKCGSAVALEQAQV